MKKSISRRKIAIITGSAYLLLFLVAIGSELFFPARIFAPGDAAQSIENIRLHEGLYRLEIFSIAWILVCDILIAWGLYELCKPVNSALSGLAAWGRILYTGITGVAVTYQVMTLSAVKVSKLTEPALRSLVESYFGAFEFARLLGLIFFGLHILVLGYMFFHSEAFPKILGALLIIAAWGYFINSFAGLFWASYPDNKTMFQLGAAIGAIISEMWLALWLLLRGAK